MTKDEIIRKIIDENIIPYGTIGHPDADLEKIMYIYTEDDLKEAVKLAFYYKKTDYRNALGKIQDILNDPSVDVLDSCTKIRRVINEVLKIDTSQVNTANMSPIIAICKDCHTSSPFISAKQRCAGCGEQELELYDAVTLTPKKSALSAREACDACCSHNQGLYDKAVINKDEIGYCDRCNLYDTPMGKDRLCPSCGGKDMKFYAAVKGE